MYSIVNVSMVLYYPKWKEVVALTKVLLQSKYTYRVYWVDNSPAETKALPMEEDVLRIGYDSGEETDSEEKETVKKRIVYIFNGKNLGYGAAHNIAIRESVYDDVPMHLVINSDILVTTEAIDTMVEFMAAHQEVGQLMPHVVYPNGETQYLCKLLPAPIDVFGRRFLPKRWMAKRNARYELRASGYDKMMNVPYLSGCFMLLRTEAVLKARLFDERFFMYPEDIDLTRRIHRDYLTIYFPYVTIVHNHAKASYHSPKMLWIHVVNMCRYFNKWGWFCDKERRQVNQATLESIETTTE